MGLMKSTGAAAAVGIAALFASGLSAPSARAGYVVTLRQEGSDVVATGSGPIDLTGLTSFGPQAFDPTLFPANGVIVTGTATSGLFAHYFGVTGPTHFGAGSLIGPNSASGDAVGVSGTARALFVPVGYTSDDVLSSAATYDGQTFATLGVTPGTYEWTWGPGPNQNFTLDAVPEPSSVMLLGVGLAMLLLVSANRRIQPAGVSRKF